MELYIPAVIGVLMATVDGAMMLEVVAVASVGEEDMMVEVVVASVEEGDVTPEVVAVAEVEVQLAIDHDKV